MLTESRGVLALHDKVTPTRTEDASKFRITVREVLFLVVGAASMWGAQVATQSRIQSAIDNLGTRFDGYIQTQMATNTELQRQIDEWRAETKLNRERDSDRQRELAEVKGLLTGLGILKETKK